MQVTRDELAARVLAAESQQPRWVWADTASVYPLLLTHGVRVDRCHDLRLCWAILRSSSLTAESALARASTSPWQTAVVASTQQGAQREESTLFELEGGEFANGGSTRGGSTRGGGTRGGGTRGGGTEGGGTEGGGTEGGGTEDGGSHDGYTEADASDGNGSESSRRPGAVDAVAELALQLDAVASAADPNRLRLLLAAESAGALIAAEMSHAGLPWREDVHDRLLTELLGPQVAPGLRPARLEELAAQIRAETGVSGLNPDSPAEVLRALRSAGLTVTTTRSWELKQLGHTAIAPLLEYKKLSRLLSANGWSWMQQWVSNGRFTPEYVPGGVVSGRWATRGGGALQLPKQVRRAVTADDGWKLVVADAAQLEPRILAGISGDHVMAAAGRDRDLYAGIVASGAVSTRAEAKVAMLGAMYGATTGESGRLLPRLARAFPTALAFVENAARAGERGEVVTSRLGRSSPRPSESWSETQARASEGAANEAELARARREARDWGRFTRNFVVQASAADWALCWMADLRRALAAFAPVELGAASATPGANGVAAPAPGANHVAAPAPGANYVAAPAPGTNHVAARGWAAAPFDARPHLVFFLHDEVIVHTPAVHAEAVADALRASAAAATRLLFGTFPLDVPLDLSIVDSYADAA
ncbi:bifunctional 3'-5' exonuclease/DNA polymerase [Subtercola endophyticus]|nr:bifunctional 3'-5' exonuclease/DNA polymerase [Subtercola endophyticus]UFS61050.1 bifunctional 3'-5' exonuclease/DNA polymerase [Subtercola endophyticus]